jgi:hypothetical protein
MYRPLCLILLAIGAPAAHAGESLIECYHAELTLDSRHVLLRPGCEISDAFDLTSGRLIGREEARRIAADAAYLPLARIAGRAPFERWLTRRQDSGSYYQWVAHEVPGSDWLLRYRVRSWHGQDAVLYGPIQYAPRADFEAAFLAKKNEVASPEAGLPLREPMKLAPIADLTQVFTPAATPDKKTAKTTTRRVSYDPAAFVRAVPTAADLTRHARMVWHHVHSEHGSTGWRIDETAPNGFWVALGFVTTPFRLVDHQGRSAHGEIVNLWSALAAGRTVAIRTFVPYHWTVVVLSPR